MSYAYVKDPGHELLNTCGRIRMLQLATEIFMKEPRPPPLANENSVASMLPGTVVLGFPPQRAQSYCSHCSILPPSGINCSIEVRKRRLNFVSFGHFGVGAGTIFTHRHCWRVGGYCI